jgi:soluble lytic murein transglycosylase-like protein
MRRALVGWLALVLVVAGVVAGGVVFAVARLRPGPPVVPAEYSALVREAAATCPGLKPLLLAAQLEQESGWNPTARSGAGAQGIAQFVPATWDAYAVDGNHDGTRDPDNPQDAIPSAAAFDCVLYREIASVPGNKDQLMLAAYNAGPDKVRKYQGVPPFAETENYVRRIMARSLVLTFPQ